MSTAINDTPPEILADILERVALLNSRESSVYTYGLSQTPERLHNERIQLSIRGHVRPDALKWSAVCDIRQVCQRWHDWACCYALRKLYISKWRGGERYKVIVEGFKDGLTSKVQLVEVSHST